ncbi:HalD/BesD family halogenase [Actinomadura sp. WAC 06369]|uniref:HalD/BesD family halogenase n=1 Tax=Actinomadura sp. WAC 06369 TaxID=2203193 RepID=UPI000F76C45B|nr:arpA protein [Actinomadura sp. WAC 06369]RSN61800.1 arpA protein [Actinomadura sp. WAC 06369]
MGAATEPDRAIDTERYPLAAPASARWDEVVSATRAELAETGCCVLPDFVRPEWQETLRAECASVERDAHFDVETVNAYNIDVHAPLPEGHPGRLTVERGNAFVARDRLPPDHIVPRLYSNPLFRHFVANCFGLPEVHELADPLSGLVLNVVRPGMEHPWHFDTNEFTVSLLTQEAEGGGVFEYCPNIRSAEAENFDDVRRVLTGEGAHLVRGLTLRPGDLQLFKGRYSLHRVSAVRGATARHTAIFAYSERPGVVGSVARTRQLFGRVLPEHHAAEGRAVRVDALLD